MSTKRLPLYELENRKEITINLICHNKIHKVTLRKRGPITLHNHDYRSELKLAKMCEALDSSVPKCVRILQYWKVHQASSYVVSSPEDNGFGCLPPEVRSFRFMAAKVNASSKRKDYARPRTSSREYSQRGERRFEWFSHIAFEPLFALHCKIREFGTDQFTVTDRSTSYGRKSTHAYDINPWLFRIGASGMLRAIPGRFPLTIETKGGHEWLVFMDKNLNEERVDISNGDRPETVTGSESEAKFEEAVRKYRLMESTSSRDHENPYNGG